VRRVPAAYLTHAILAILAGSAERGMNNLRASNKLDVPTPPASTMYYIDFMRGQHNRYYQYQRQRSYFC
jgi:hypothetical protein